MSVPQTDLEVVEALEQRSGAMATWALDAINSGMDPWSVWVEFCNTDEGRNG